VLVQAMGISTGCAVRYPPVMSVGHIAFTDGLPLQKSAIYTIGTDRAITKVIPLGANDPALSPDGAKLVYTSGAHVSSWNDPKMANIRAVFFARGSGSAPRDTLDCLARAQTVRDCSGIWRRENPRSRSL